MKWNKDSWLHPDMFGNGMWVIVFKTMDPLYTPFTPFTNINIYHFYSIYLNGLFDMKCLIIYLLFFIWKYKGTHFEERHLWRVASVQSVLEMESSILHLIVLYFDLKSWSWFLSKCIRLGETAPGWFRKLLEKTSFHKGSQEEVQRRTDHVCGVLRWNWEWGLCFILQGRTFGIFCLDDYEKH